MSLPRPTKPEGSNLIGLDLESQNSTPGRLLLRPGIRNRDAGRLPEVGAWGPPGAGSQDRNLEIWPALVTAGYKSGASSVSE